MTRSIALRAFSVVALLLAVGARADADGGVFVDGGSSRSVDAGSDAGSDGGSAPAGADAGSMEAADPAVPAVDGGLIIVDAGIEFVDAGEAALAELVDGGAPASEHSPVHEEPANVVAHDAVSPLRFVRTEGRSSARARASLASRALVAALEADPEREGGDDVSVRSEDDVIVARIGGMFVAAFTDDDVVADGGGDPEAWAAARESQLAAFVSGQRQRDHIRHTVSRVTLSVAIALLAFLLLRVQRRLFASWQESLDQRAPMSAPVVFGVPILSADAARAVLVFALQIVRVLALGGTVFAAVVTIGGQFERTRPWVDSLVDGLISPMVHGAQSALRGVPGVLLAAVIALIAFAAWRFVRILLDGVAAGRVHSSLVEREQATVARVLIGAIVGLVAALLIVAALFLRFGTAVEDLVLVAAAAIGAGTVPFFANAVAGLAVQWRRPFTVGDHVRVGTAHGEVVRIRVHDVLLVPEEGGTITVPMLALLLRPLQRLSSEPRAHIDTIVARDRSSDAVLDVLQRQVKLVDENGRVEVIAATSSTLAVRLIAGRGEGAQQTLWRALLKACDAGEVRLAERTGATAVVKEVG